MQRKAVRSYVQPGEGERERRDVQWGSDIQRGSDVWWGSDVQSGFEYYSHE